MTESRQPPHGERVEKRTATEAMLIAASLVQLTIEVGKVVHHAIKARPPKEEPPQIVLPPGVDLDK